MRLTPEQRTRIQPIVQRNIDELTKAWRQSILGSREIVERMEREIAAELTPEQRDVAQGVVSQLTDQIRNVVQDMIYQRLARRRSVFLG